MNQIADQSTAQPQAANVPQRTPCGRIADTPLRNPRHEALAHASVQGKTGRDAGLAAGYKDGPGLKGNIARLRQQADIRERIAEIALHSAELAEIYDGWILSDMALFARASIADFCKRDDDGKLVLTDAGLPQLDFTHTAIEQMRVVQKIKRTRYGVELEIRDPVNALEKLMRNRGLMRDKLALTDPSGVNPAYYVISERPMTEAEWEAQRAGSAPAGA
jgi:hypothetical protein